MGDVYFPQTELLLPFDGSNGATATSDLSDNNHSVTFAGNAQISTAQSKVGGSSIYFDGSGDYISTPSSSAFAFGTADFTIEFWVRRTGTGSYPYVFDFRAGVNAAVAYLYLKHADSYKLQLSFNGSGLITSTAGLALNTWYHIAIVRSSGTTTMYMDGSSVGSASNSASYVAAPFYMGDYSGGGYGFTGYMDNLRITKGIARYTSSFTPPTTAHLTSAGDVNKQILVNETADGVAIGTGGINQVRLVRAWVSFNGTGTVAIRDNYNVSSVTDTGTGNFTLNFSSAMTDTNYCAVGMSDANNGENITVQDSILTTTTLGIVTIASNGTVVADSTMNNVVIFGS